MPAKPFTGGVRIDPEKLKVCREVAGMTQTELAHRTGISVESISSYERGIRRPSGAYFRRLFIALGVGPEDLLTNKAAKLAIKMLAERRKLNMPDLEELWDEDE
jgi:transcriptional regulator with XRE-family HTH domain